MNKLTVLTNRLEKIGITIELFGNYPWVYLHSINGKRVTERYEANHGFTIAWMPIRSGQSIEFTDLSHIFKTIRNYIK